MHLTTFACACRHNQSLRIELGSARQHSAALAAELSETKQQLAAAYAAQDAATAAAAAAQRLADDAAAELKRQRAATRVQTRQQQQFALAEKELSEERTARQRAETMLDRERALLTRVCYYVTFNTYLTVSGFCLR